MRSRKRYDSSVSKICLCVSKYSPSCNVGTEFIMNIDNIRVIKIYYLEHYSYILERVTFFSYEDKFLIPSYCTSFVGSHRKYLGNSRSDIFCYFCQVSS